MGIPQSLIKKINKLSNDVTNIQPIIAVEVEEYLTEHPPTGYEHPSTHPATMITEDENHNFVTQDGKYNIHPLGADNQDLSGLAPVNHNHTGIYEPANENIQTHVISTHAPVNAQKNSDITKGEIEAKLTGEISSHSHAGGGGADPWTIIKLAQDFTTSSASNTNVTNFFFTLAANKTYLIFGYFLLRTATATIGARPGVAWPSNLVDAIMRMEASNSLTASAIRTWGSRSTQNAASTGLATTTNSHWSSLDGIIITASNVSGNLQITLASETAGTNVTIKAGSILMYREL